MKKFFLFITLIAFSGLILTSCGGGDSAKTTTTKAKEEVKKTESAKKEPAKTETVDASKVQGNAEKGKEVYTKTCVACHLKGVAGAPALDNKEEWTKRAGQGMNTLLEHAIKGFQGETGVMPPKGTCNDCSDADLKSAIMFMLDKAGVAAK